MAASPPPRLALVVAATLQIGHVFATKGGQWVDAFTNGDILPYRSFPGLTEFRVKYVLELD
ncbi:MAG: hypothetical protein ABSF67_01255 [Roseiarcus sp.]|jgi:hypothetical protein